MMVFAPKIPDKIMYNKSGYKERYYKVNFGIDYKYEKSKIKNICEEYLKIIMWNFKYYFDTCPSFVYQYPYLHSPLLSDFSLYFNELNKDKLFLLKDHPKFIELLDNTYKLKQKEFSDILKQILKISNKKYSLVFEHGDLAPWNIFEDLDGNIRLFDFEYFENNGLEFMDKFNYFYQIGTLLKKMNYDELSKFLKSKIQVQEFYNVFAIFLIKKIINKIKEESNYIQELDFLKKVSKKIQYD
jgi:hypothetical protein